jgi:hypothetical protein
VFSHLTQAELQAIAAEPYEARGIPHSEMALIIDTCRRLGVEVFIESGRARGQSTYMLAKYLPGIKIHSIDFRPNHPDEAFARERMRGLLNVALYTGDGAQFLPAVAKASAPHRTAVLCDGPKGLFAVGVVEKCFRHPHVVAGFIHDMRPIDHGRPSPYRAAAEAVFAGFFSDHPDYIANTSWMDAKVVEANGPVGPKQQAEFGSYGPTVGVFINTAFRAQPNSNKQTSDHSHALAHPASAD